MKNPKKSTDLTFLTNQEGRKLIDRFKDLCEHTAYFDCLVAYFYLTGFYRLYKYLENVEKIRILIGIGTDQTTFQLTNSLSTTSQNLFSHKEIKNQISELIKKELENSNDTIDIEEGIRKFIQWIQSGKLQIRAHRSQKLHAKLYIFTFKEKSPDEGRVITGSSNLTQAGLEENLEFNVELKNVNDYQFALEKFDELWRDSVDLTEKYVQTLKNDTWINDTISPYELYLKMLYEYFQTDLSLDNQLSDDDFPEGFKRFKYQEQAVLNAIRIMNEHGGVFLSDVVGLGKTYIAAMIIKQLGERPLVIAPPALLDRNNPGSWINVFTDFGILAQYFSIGKLNEALKETKRRKYNIIIIDEAHRFRTEDTQRYNLITQICREKRVILVSATPYNNSPSDLFNLIKLFQSPRNSTIPGVKNLESFFKKAEKELKKIDRNQDFEKYLEVSRQISQLIREKVLKHIMVRRTRKEIEQYFKEDLRKNHIQFPDIKDPKPFFYQLNKKEDEIFMKTMHLITTQLHYARYTPLLYSKENVTDLQKQSQKNLRGFMKALLVKRLESSFHAFKKTLNRFIQSYELFISAYNQGSVYITTDYSSKLYELLQQGDDEAILKLISEGKVHHYKASNFSPQLKEDLLSDLEILKEIQSMWENINRDPKLEKFLHELKTNPILNNNQNKIIIFTEAKETGDYLYENIRKAFGDIVLFFHGTSDEKLKNLVIENFDANFKHPRDDYRILISTEALSEGVNLHRANIVINYDIPWNPTKLIQRIGRVNRINTPFNEIHIFNFFPTEQADSEIELTKIARSKIQTFLNMLGGDSAILTEGEPVTSHNLFNKLLSKQTFMEEDEEESELKYFSIIEEIRDKNPKLFEKITKLPKKARTARLFSDNLKTIAKPESLLTFFRQGKLVKFFLSNHQTTSELDFLTAVKILECSPNEKSRKIPIEKYYHLLGKNKDAFRQATSEELLVTQKQGGRSNETQLKKILKMFLNSSTQLTEEQEKDIADILACLNEGIIPKTYIRNALKKINTLRKNNQFTPDKVVSILRIEIPQTFKKRHYSTTSDTANQKREVILSLYLREKNEI